MNIRVNLLSIVLFCTSTPVLAQLDQMKSRIGLGKGSELSESKVGSGLKEALRIGAENSVKVTGKKDGYFGDQAIKILLPKNLRPLEKGLGAMGYQPKIDAFVLSMNRAAEAAAPSARKIFGDAILAMTFDDARKILSGSDTAATDYFKAKTTDQLTVAFRPFVGENYERERRHPAIQRARWPAEVHSFRQKRKLGHQQVCPHQSSRRTLLCPRSGRTKNPQKSRGSHHRFAEAGLRQTPRLTTWRL